jgi:glutathione synthase
VKRVIGFQMDPFERLNAATDSTLLLAAEAAERGFQTFAFEPGALSYHDGTCWARGTWFVADRAGHLEPHVATQKDDAIALPTCDLIWMRQDPPFDMQYIAATYLLESLGAATVILNSPSAVRDAPEKWLVTQWPDFIPATCISADVETLYDFYRQHAHIVCKPLFGHAGHGVAAFQRGDDSALRSHLEDVLVSHTPVVVQAFLPDVLAGDKRVVIVEGEIVGAFQRVPASGDFRANLRLGATPQPTSLTPREQEICRAVGQELQRRDLFLAGIDLIQEHLIEINLTSPTGLVTLNQLYDLHVESVIWDAALRRLPRSAKD